MNDTNETLFSSQSYQQFQSSPNLSTTIQQQQQQPISNQSHQYSNQSSNINTNINSIQPHISTHVTDLDVTLLAKIFSYLPVQDMLRIGSVCHHFHTIISNPSLWETLDLTSISHKVTDSWLIEFLSHPRFRYLQALNLSTCSALTDTFLNHLPDLLPYLHTLDISYCTGFTPDAIVKMGLIPNLQRYEVFHSLHPDHIPHVVESILDYRRQLYSNNNIEQQQYNNNNNPKELKLSMYSTRFFNDNNDTRIAISPDQFLTQYNTLPPTQSTTNQSSIYNNNSSSSATSTTTIITPQQISLLKQQLSSQPTIYRPSTNPNIPQDFIDLGKTALNYCLIVNLNPLNLYNSNYSASKVLLGQHFDPYDLFRQQEQQRRELEGGERDGQRNSNNNDDIDDDEDDNNNNIWEQDENNGTRTNQHQIPTWLQTFKPCCTASMLGQCFGKIKQVPVYSYNITTNNSQITATTTNTNSIPPSMHSYGHWFQLSYEGMNNDHNNTNNTNNTQTNNTQALSLRFPNFEQDDNNINQELDPTQTTTPTTPISSSSSQTSTLGSKKLILYPHAPLRITIAGLFAECSAHRGMTGTRENVMGCLNCGKFFLTSNIIMDGWCIGCIASENFGISVGSLFHAISIDQNSRRRNAQQQQLFQERLFIKFPPIHPNLPSGIIRNMTLIDTITFNFNINTHFNLNDNNEMHVIELNDLTLQHLRQLSQQTTSNNSTSSTSTTLTHCNSQQLTNNNNSNPISSSITQDKILSLHSEQVINDGRILYDPTSLEDYDLNNHNDQDVLGLLGVVNSNIDTSTNTQRLDINPDEIDLFTQYYKNIENINNQNNNINDNSTTPATSNETSSTSPTSIRVEVPHEPTNFITFYEQLQHSQTQLEHFYKVVEKMHHLGYKRTIITTTPPFITHQHVHSQCLSSSIPGRSAQHRQQNNNNTNDNNNNNTTPDTTTSSSTTTPRQSTRCSINDPPIPYFVPTILDNKQSTTTQLQQKLYEQQQEQLQQIQQQNPNKLYIYADCRGSVGHAAEKSMYIHDYSLRTSPLWWLSYFIVALIVLSLTQCFVQFTTNLNLDTTLTTNSPTYYIQEDVMFDNVILILLITVAASVIFSCLILFIIIRYQERCLRLYYNIMPVHFGILMLASNVSLIFIASLGLNLKIDWISIGLFVIYFTLFQILGLFLRPLTFNLRQITILSLSATCASSFAVALPILALVIGFGLVGLIDLFASNAFPVLMVDQPPGFLRLTPFPHISYPITPKTAIRMGELLLFGILIGTIYRISSYYSIIGLLFTFGTIGHAFIIQPYRSTGTNGALLLRPTVILSFWLVLCYCDSLITFNIHDVLNTDNISQLVTHNYNESYISGVIPYFMHVMSSPATQQFTHFYLQVQK